MYTFYAVTRVIVFALRRKGEKRGGMKGWLQNKFILPAHGNKQV